MGERQKSIPSHLSGNKHFIPPLKINGIKGEK